MKKIILYIYLFITLGCKNVSNSNIQRIITETKGIEKTNVNCLTESDKIEVEKVIANIINSIENDDEDSISSILNFPISIFNFSFDNQAGFITEWNKSEELKNWFYHDLCGYKSKPPLKNSIALLKFTKVL